MRSRAALIGLLTLALTTGPLALAAAHAQSKEAFVPLLVYRTGPYAPSGIPIANGMVDYFNMLNERDGGVNGVKIVFEECETQYDTKQGVECYERLKGKSAPRSIPTAPASRISSFPGRRSTRSWCSRWATA
jgi:branched-chain amino acid transport system substrate-binding protein